MRNLDGSYSTIELELAIVIIMEAWFVFDVMTKDKLLASAHTTPQMLAKWFYHIFRRCKHMLLECNDFTGAYIKLLLALQPNALSTLHLLFVINDQLKQEDMAELQLSKTAYDALATEIYRYQNMYSKIILCFCNTAVLAANTHDCLLWCLGYREPVWDGRYEMYDWKTVRMHVADGEDVFTPLSDFDSASMLCMFGWRRPRVAHPATLDDTNVHFDKNFHKFIVQQDDVPMVMDEFVCQAYDPVMLVSGDTAGSVGEEKAVANVADYSQSTWPHNAASIVFTSRMGFGFSADQSPSPIDFEAMTDHMKEQVPDWEAPVIEDWTSHVNLLSNCGMEGTPDLFGTAQGMNRSRPGKNDKVALGVVSTPPHSLCR